jgi:hypothetical protein
MQPLERLLQGLDGSVNGLLELGLRGPLLVQLGLLQHLVAVLLHLLAHRLNRPVNLLVHLLLAHAQHVRDLLVHGLLTLWLLFPLRLLHRLQRGNHPALSIKDSGRGHILLVLLRSLRDP